MNSINFLSIIIPALAVLIAPIVSYWALSIFNHRKAQQTLKDGCFFTLFTYRASPMAREFVNALNSVPLVFKDNERIVEKWRDLINHLNTNSKENQNWFNTAYDLRCSLMAEISKKTSYQKYSINDVKNDAYIPQGYSDNEMLYKSIPTNIEKIANALAEQTAQIKEFYAQLSNANKLTNNIEKNNE